MILYYARKLLSIPVIQKTGDKQYQMNWLNEGRSSSYFLKLPNGIVVTLPFIMARVQDKHAQTGAPRTDQPDHLAYPSYKTVQKIFDNNGLKKITKTNHAVLI